MPTELELIALETEFDLYLSFTKRLVLNLPDSEDRTRAAIWLQKLRATNSDEQKKLRNEHLKLLLFALHRRSILGVFEKPPPEELESFHDGHTLMEMTRELIEITERQLGSGDNPNECPLPAVSTNVSADLKEYCASQSIPKFGAHVYYAVSNEPIQMWSKSANCIYPAQSDVPNPLQWELTLSKLTDHVLEKQAEAEKLAAEAANEDKDEEKDNALLLPKIDVPVCPGKQPFKWKPDSILTLHQNYDFSDVGVAEDLEEQGKYQLELDEMAFGILDHSLPGRQRVVVRDPYYKDLPPDLAERRHHGVIDEVSESEEEEEEEPYVQLPPRPPPPPAPLVCPQKPPCPTRQCPPAPCPPPTPCGGCLTAADAEEQPCADDDQQWDCEDEGGAYGGGECNCGQQDQSAAYSGGKEWNCDECIEEEEVAEQNECDSQWPDQQQGHSGCCGSNHDNRNNHY